MSLHKQVVTKSPVQENCTQGSVGWALGSQSSCPDYHQFNRREFLKTSALVAASAITLSSSNLFAEETTAKSKPNIVYILADDLGYGDISCFNENSKIQTPNIDRLAKEGMAFTDAHSAAALCTPSRYGILTGTFPFRTVGSGNCTGYSGPKIRENQLTVAKLLQNNGYHTGTVGKWHLG